MGMKCSIKLYLIRVNKETGSTWGGVSDYLLNFIFGIINAEGGEEFAASANQ
jgi:hypothetical protein